MAPEVDVSTQFKEAARRALEACIHIVPSGSGVFIEANLVLTCAHCVSHDDDDDDDDDEPPKTRLNRVKELVTPHGRTFGAKCIAYDEELDLALLETIDSAQKDHAFLSLAESEPNQIFAIGNPYDIDLETDLKDQPTGFTPFWFSGGEYEAVTIKASKPGLGRLKHSCWTYWGHSGCPLIAVDDWADGGIMPSLAGLHNSWDDRNAQRHGVPLEELKMFLSKHLNPANR